jgi:hypothetical protein
MVNLNLDQDCNSCFLLDLTTKLAGLSIVRCFLDLVVPIDNEFLCSRAETRLLNDLFVLLS